MPVDNAREQHPATAPLPPAPELAAVVEAEDPPNQRSGRCRPRCMLRCRCHLLPGGRRAEALAGRMRR